MSLENWNGVAEMGAVYPMIGTEGLLVVIGVAYWIIWHIVNTRKEQDKLREDTAEHKRRKSSA